MSITGFVVMVITWEFFGLGFGEHRSESREAVLVAVYYGRQGLLLTVPLFHDDDE